MEAALRGDLEFVRSHRSTMTMEQKVLMFDVACTVNRDSFINMLLLYVQMPINTSRDALTIATAFGNERIVSFLTSRGYRTVETPLTTTETQMFGGRCSSTDMDMITQESLGDEDDVIVFIPKERMGTGFCISRSAILKYWEGSESWVHGDCRGTRTMVEVYPDLFCRRYYRMPNTNLPILQGAVDTIMNNENVSVWVVHKTDRPVHLGKWMHVSSEYNKENADVYFVRGVNDIGDVDVPVATDYTTQELEPWGWMGEPPPRYWMNGRNQADAYDRGPPPLAGEPIVEGESDPTMDVLTERARIQTIVLTNAKLRMVMGTDRDEKIWRPQPDDEEIESEILDAAFNKDKDTLTDLVMPGHTVKYYARILRYLDIYIDDLADALANVVAYGPYNTTERFVAIASRYLNEHMMMTFIERYMDPQYMGTSSNALVYYSAIVDGMVHHNILPLYVVRDIIYMLLGTKKFADTLVSYEPGGSRYSFLYSRTTYDRIIVPLAREHVDNPERVAGLAEGIVVNMIKTPKMFFEYMFEHLITNYATQHYRYTYYTFLKYTPESYRVYVRILQLLKPYLTSHTYNSTVLRKAYHSNNPYLFYYALKLPGVVPEMYFERSVSNPAMAVSFVRAGIHVPDAIVENVEFLRMVYNDVRLGEDAVAKLIREYRGNAGRLALACLQENAGFIVPIVHEVVGLSKDEIRALRHVSRDDLGGYYYQEITNLRTE